MSAFVLIHGAWHGGWCWREMAALLRAQGHTVFTPSLSGNAEHGHQNSPSITLETHVRDVIGVFEAEGIERAVLVGHSYGGIVITVAADRIATRVERMVYLDAFAPTHGENAVDCILRSVTPEAAQAYTTHFHSAAQHGGLIPPIPGEMFGQTPTTSERMRRYCNAQSLATLYSPALISGAANAVPKHYVLATAWHPSPFPAQAKLAREAGWTVTEIASGHCLMMDAARATADALLKV